MKQKIKNLIRNTVNSAVNKWKNFNSTKLTFILIGLISTLWFLIRVIPKPSRAAYPCMRAAKPLASSFVLYIIGMTSSVFLFKKAKKTFHLSQFKLTIILILLGFIVGSITSFNFSKNTYAYPVSKLESPNSPMGIGKGIFPGRVVWMHNVDATNENMTNTAGDYWWNDKNTNQKVVDSMFSEGIKDISGAINDKSAWDSIFCYYNRTHNRGNFGYKPGEKIVVKINFNAGSGGPGVNTSPQICYSLLNQLIKVAGVSQVNISIGDPNIDFTEENYNKCHTAFPNVRYWGSSTGRTAVKLSKTEPLITSDGMVKDYLPQDYIDATYMINMPVFKKHHRAGISLCSKNHFGSLTPYTGDAFHVHYSLPCPLADGDPSNGSYGEYRVFVDFMGHKDLGAKTIIYIIDGIWGSVNYAHPPIKWRMSPFNNDWPSSIFISQDPVAIESVGFDFLYKEFDVNNPVEGGVSTMEKGPFPHFPGVDDFLHQAADPANWPANFVYHPNGDTMTSQGVHEHWNNASDKQYSRNLGIGDGIELYSPEVITSIKHNNSDANGFKLLQNYPNPFKSNTTIRYNIAEMSNVKLDIYSINGQLIKSLINTNQNAGYYSIQWDGKNQNNQIFSGQYICKISIRNKNKSIQLSNKIQIIQ
jgi:hypothetical protein